MANLFQRVMGERSWEEWIAQYALAHQHPVNRFCHSLGIPLVALSLLGVLAAVVWAPLLSPSLALFICGWVLQFLGHAFEGKPPEFFRDWRFLLVGLRWWLAKMRGHL